MKRAMTPIEVQVHRGVINDRTAGRFDRMLEALKHMARQATHAERCVLLSYDEDEVVVKVAEQEKLIWDETMALDRTIELIEAAKTSPDLDCVRALAVSRWLQRRNPHLRLVL